MPVAILVLGLGSFSALVWADALEPMQQGYIGLGIILVTPLLLAIWLMFLSGLRWSHRFLYLILASVATAGLIYGLVNLLLC